MRHVGNRLHHLAEARRRTSFGVRGRMMSIGRKRQHADVDVVYYAPNARKGPLTNAKMFQPHKLAACDAAHGLVI